MSNQYKIQQDEKKLADAKKSLRCSCKRRQAIRLYRNETGCGSPVCLRRYGRRC